MNTTDSYESGLNTPFPERIRDVALLHVLATHPERVLPAGKSLRVGLLRPDTEAEVSSLEARVSDAMQRAFWDQVRVDFFTILSIF